MPDRSARCRAAHVLAGLLLAAAATALPRAAEAGFIGDPTFTNGTGRFSVTGELDLILDRDMDPTPGTRADISTNRLFANAAYGFGRNVDGFVKLGLFDGEVDPGGGDIESSLAVGFGVKGAFVDRGEIRLGALGQLLYFQSELDNAAGSDIDWFEIDIALAASFRGLGQIVPYGGLKVSLVEGEIEPGTDFEQDDTLGIFGGLTFAVSSQLSVGAEIRMIDETALGGFLRLLF